MTGRFPRRERLTSGAEFQALFQNGTRVNGPSLVVLWRPGKAEESRRAGFAVSRQIKGSVARNRAKRRLREAYRAARGVAPERVAMVVIAKPGALSAPMDSLTSELERALASIPGARPTA